METETLPQSLIAQGKTFVWHEVYAPDAQKTVDFYTAALGFESTEMDMGDMGTYQMLTRDGAPVAGVQSTNRPDMAHVPPHWAAYLSVADVDASLDKCVSLGATIVVPPMDIPTVGRIALIQDPQGATIWLFKGAS